MSVPSINKIIFSDPYIGMYFDKLHIYKECKMVQCNINIPIIISWTVNNIIRKIFHVYNISKQISFRPNYTHYLHTIKIEFSFYLVLVLSSRAAGAALLLYSLIFITLIWLGLTEFGIIVPSFHVDWALVVTSSRTIWSIVSSQWCH